jgi:hypothetical protein
VECLRSSFVDWTFPHRGGSFTLSPLLLQQVITMSWRGW